MSRLYTEAVVLSVKNKSEIGLTNASRCGIVRYRSTDRLTGKGEKEMSTRGAIARVKGDGWEGIYQHNDSYPTRLGQCIWDKLHNGYNMDIERFLTESIDQHPKGWSNYPGSCYCHDWDRAGDPDMLLTSGDCDPLFIEWVYALNARTKTMAILTAIEVTTKPSDSIASHHCETSQTRHLDGTVSTDPESWYVHQFVTVIRLEDNEPDWAAIEKKGEAYNAR